MQEYAARIGRMTPVEVIVFDSEAALLEAGSRQTGRPMATLVLFDSAGEAMTSEEFGRMVGRMRDDGAQRILFGVGPADGWSAAARGRAQKLVSFGRMTMPHELARVVVAEQVYRALTILAGHPYHGGH